MNTENVNTENASTENASTEKKSSPHPLRWTLLGVAAVALAAFGIWFAFRWSDRGAEEASLDEAVESARSRGNGNSNGEDLLQPATGVYTYSAKGTETLSLLGTSQDWGATVPGAVVALGDGCWEQRLDYSTHHWHSQTFCARGRVLEEVSGTIFQSFDFVATTVDELTEFTCDPPGEAVRLDAEPGDVWQQSCTGISGRGTTVVSAGDDEFLGEETLEIEGEEVPVLHYKLTREMSGDQRGNEANEQWYHARTGLLVKTVHDIEVASPSPIGDVIYTEKGELVLTSLTPQT